MSTVLSTFCTALGIKDPHAVLVERARADVEAFRWETVAVVELVLSCRQIRALCDGAPSSWTLESLLWLLTTPSLSLAALSAAAHIRALSEVLGCPMPPSVEEEREVALLVAALAVAVAVDVLFDRGLVEEAAKMRALLPFKDLMGDRMGVIHRPIAGDVHAALISLVREDDPENCGKWAGRCVQAAGPAAVEKARALVAALAGAEARDG